MTSEELAQASEALIVRSRARILGVGERDYSHGDTQSFETMPLDVLLSECEDEIIDTVNYCAMLMIKLERIRNALIEAENRA